MISNYQITNKIINLIAEITEKITEIKINQKPDLHLRKISKIQSIQASIAIEANSLTINQITDVINGKRVLAKEQEIIEAKNAYQIYEEILNFNPYEIKDFLKVHRILTKNLISESGVFRNGDVGVFDGSGNVVHMGARPQFIENLMKNLFNTMEKSDLNYLIKSCIFHFEIEIIHPFADGNGRMGRFWQSLLLVKEIEEFQYIPVETLIHQNQMQYYKVLNESNTTNNSTLFIEFMLDLINQTLSESKNNFTDKITDKITVNLTNKDKEFLNLVGKHLLQNEFITNNQAQNLTNKSNETVKKQLQKLVEMNLLIPQGEKKGRKYYLNQEQIKR